MDALDELLAFLGSCDGATDEWLPPLDAAEAPRLSLAGAGDVGTALASPRLEQRAVPHNPPQLEFEPRVAPKKRRTRKQDIQALQDLVAQLTTRLNALKTEASISLATPIARIPAGAWRSAETSKDVVMLRLWEQLAARQLRKRRASEQENRELRQAASAHVRGAKRLRQMLLRRFKEESSALSDAISKSRSTLATAMPVTDDDLLSRLAADMDALFADVDAALERGGLAAMRRPSRSSSALRVGAEDWAVELRSVNVLPFDLQRTARAVWTQQVGDAATKSLDEFKQQTEFTYADPQGMALRIQKTTVSRRHVEKHRTVMIERSVIKPTVGILVDYTTRIVIKPGPMSIAGPTTEVVTYLTGAGKISVAIQKMLGDRLNPDFDFNIGQWEKAAARSEDNLESMLLAEAVKAS